MNFVHGSSGTSINLIVKTMCKISQEKCISIGFILSNKGYENIEETNKLGKIKRR